MKKINLLLTGLLLFVLLLNSCISDSEEPSNHFTYDGKTYNLGKGYIKDYGDNGNGSYDFDIYLVSPTMQYSTSDNEFEGMGELLYLDLNTSSSSGLVNGTYNYSSNRGTFTFVYGNVTTDIDLPSEYGETTYINGGEVDVKVDGNIITLDFDLTTTGNKKITGRFKKSLSSI